MDTEGIFPYVEYYAKETACLAAAGYDLIRNFLTIFNTFFQERVLKGFSEKTALGRKAFFSSILMNSTAEVIMPWVEFVLNINKYAAKVIPESGVTISISRKPGNLTRTK